MSDVGRFAGRDRFPGRDLEAEVRADCGAASPDKGQTKQNDGTWTALDPALAQRFADVIRMADLDGAACDPAGASKAAIDDPPDRRTDDLTDVGEQQVLLLAQSSAPSSHVSAFTLLATQETPPAANGAAIADRISRLVDQAIRADLASLPGRPMEVVLTLAGVVPGLEGLTVSMTDGALEVVFQRSAAIQATTDLRAAATGLADSLRQRFGKRVVRIYDRGPVVPTAPEGDAASEAT